MKWQAKKNAVDKRPETSDQTEQVSSRLGRKVLLGATIFLITIWTIIKITNPATFPIKEVKVIDASARINHKLLQDTISPYLNNGLLLLNKSDLKNALIQLPWVANTTISRHWPNKLIINITEEKPIAYWNNSELLDEHLSPFNPGTFKMTENLPLLNGPDNEQSQVWNWYVTLNQMLAPLSLQIRVLTLTPRGALEMELNNGLILILGRDDTKNRLADFISVYHKIFEGKTDQVEYVDLRYSNGLAVKWKNNS